MPGRTIAIGDIHGCSLALDSLLSAIGPMPNDTLVTLGDYIDRGPGSRQVIDRLLSLSRQCNLVPILGNHEEMLLEALNSKTAIEKWLQCGGVDTLRSYGWVRGGLPRPLRSWFPESQLEFISRCRSFYETEFHLFVHAGVLPDLPMATQPGVVLRSRVTDAASAVAHGSGKVAIVRHTPQFSGDVLNLGFLICKDTNCVRSGWLTALDIESGQTWQANSAGVLRNAG